MPKRLLTLFLLLYISIFSLSAQSTSNIEKNDKKLTQFNIDSWGIDNGMSSNTINDVQYGSDGYLWLGTFNGIVRFDGVKFRSYTSKDDPDLITNGVRTLFEDSRKNLWIGTNGEGLIKYVDGNFIGFPKDGIMENGIVTAIAEANDGCIWVGTRSGIYILQKGKFKRLAALEELATASINAIEIRNDDIWIGTNTKGLYHLKKGVIVNKYSADDLNSNSIRTLSWSSENQLWIGTNNGLYTLDDGEFEHKELEKLGRTIVSTIVERSPGVHWIGTSQGLVRICKTSIEVLSKKDGLPDNIIEDISFDSEGNAWLATYQGGIIRLKDGKFANYGTKEGLPDNVINVVYHDSKIGFAENKKIWIGTNNGLGLLEDGKVESISLGPSSMRNRIRDIFRDSNGRLWLCTYDGLINYDNGLKKRYGIRDGLVSEIVRVITEDNEGQLWIGTGSGLSSFKNGVFKNYGRAEGLKNSFIMSLHVDSKGNLWIGTDGGGLYKFKDEKFKHFGVEDGLPSNIIFKITEDNLGDLWIGTSGGVSRYKEDKFSTIGMNQNLISNTVFQVLIDRTNSFWFLTNNGVQQTNLIELDAVINGDQKIIENFKLYNNEEGMRSSVVTAASSGTIMDNGIVWIPTLNGLTNIDPSNIVINNVPPPIKIEAILVNGKENLASLSEIEVSSGRQDLEIRYSGLSFYAPEKVKFKYQLFPFDKDWINVGTRRTAYYTNVPPGNYIFKVLAANNDDVWSEQPATISINKEALFYELKEFYLLLILLTAVLAFIIYKVRTKYLKEKNIELKKLVETRTADISRQREELVQLNNVKDKLFSVISHDLRSPLSSLSGLLSLTNSNSVSLEEVKMLTENISDKLVNASNMLDNLLVWAKSQMKGIKLDKVPVPLSQLVEEHINLVRSEATKKNLKLSSSLKDEIVFADMEVVKLTLRNLLANAIKFTPEGGEIEVSAETKENFVEISIKDSGIGINAEDSDRIFSQEYYSHTGTSNEMGSGLGLMLCKEFIQMEGGEIWAKTNFDKGSTFTFKLSSQAN